MDGSEYAVGSKRLSCSRQPRVDKKIDMPVLTFAVVKPHETPMWHETGALVLVQNCTGGRAQGKGQRAQQQHGDGLHPASADLAQPTGRGETRECLHKAEIRSLGKELQTRPALIGGHKSGLRFCRALQDMQENAMDLPGSKAC